MARRQGHLFLFLPLSVSAANKWQASVLAFRRSVLPQLQGRRDNRNAQAIQNASWEQNTKGMQTNNKNRAKQSRVRSFIKQFVGYGPRPPYTSIPITGFVDAGDTGHRRKMRRARQVE